MSTPVQTMSDLLQHCISTSLSTSPYACVIELQTEHNVINAQPPLVRVAQAPVFPVKASSIKRQIANNRERRPMQILLGS